jgi:hypothetical protein
MPKTSQVVVQCTSATDAAFVRALSSWPLWPVLPLTRSTPSDPLECGFLYADNAREEDGIIVYKENIYAVAWGMATSKIPQQRYTTVEEMFADGWRIN